MIRYVGQSIRGMKRPLEHWAPTKGLRRFDHCHNWVRQVISSGFIPEIEIIQGFDNVNFTQEMLDDAEDFWIEYFRYIGCPLTNLRRGGRGGSLAPETRAKISITNKNPSLEAKKKWYAAVKGKPRLKSRKKVVCLTDGREFEWPKAAADFYGILVESVRQSARFGRPTRTRKLNLSPLRFTYV